MTNPAGSSVGRWLASLADWTWWITFSFRREVARDDAAQAFARLWRALARDLLGEHVPIAFAIDPHEVRGWHVHALIAIPPRHQRTCDDRLLASQWRRAHASAGQIRAARYDRNRGATYYLAEKEWQVIVACPRRNRCRSRGCTEERRLLAGV